MRRPDRDLVLHGRGGPTVGSIDWAADDPDSHRQAVYAIEALAEGGSNLGRPLVDRIKGSSLHNLPELRPGSAGTTEMRILFAFDPWRSSVLL